jgi:hypothetical protein
MHEGGVTPQKILGWTDNGSSNQIPYYSSLMIESYTPLCVENIGNRTLHGS